jgi:hypothetical protein
MQHVSVATAVNAALSPGRFFVSPPARLRIERATDERLAWELFRGHLVDPAHTRQSIAADVWGVFLDADSRATQPLITVVHEHGADRLHVTRQILVHGFEAYEESPGVILTQPAQKWTRELVASVDVGTRSSQYFSEWISQGVFLALVGVSRLPITSLESPLPAYSLGQMGYCPALAERESPSTDPVAYLASALASDRWRAHEVKAFETCLRAITAEQTGDVVRALVAAAEQRTEPMQGIEPETRIGELFRQVFNQVALSPHTQFTARLTAVLAELAAPGSRYLSAATDALGFMLRTLCRHLTAFDLTLFHNFGANYPDALFLDQLLRTYINVFGRQPSLIQTAEGDSPIASHCKRLRRRALRQGALVRKHYEGHRVPDAPTSMGENLRVLPAPFARVPEEQITQPRARRQQLFENQPTAGLFDAIAHRVLDESLAELNTADEVLELGMAVFLARPLGVFKEQGEVDRTPLVAYEAFSRSIARRRLHELHAADWIDAEVHRRLVEQLDAIPPAGVPVSSLNVTETPGVVSLADVAKSSPDFVLLRSTVGSLKSLLSLYDLAPLRAIAPDIGAWLDSNTAKLLLPGEPTAAGQATLRLLDDHWQCLLTLGLARSDAAPSDGGFRDGERFERMQVLSVTDGDAAGHRRQRVFNQSPVWLKLR